MSNETKRNRELARLRRAERAAYDAGNIVEGEACLRRIRELRGLPLEAPPRAATAPPRSIYDLPIARRMWEADARDIER